VLRGIHPLDPEIGNERPAAVLPHALAPRVDHASGEQAVAALLGVLDGADLVER